MTRFLYDTNVFVYAAGGDHPYREPCRAIVASATEGQLRGEASADLVQEFLQQRFRQVRDRAQAARDALDVMLLCALHELDRADVARGAELFVDHDRLDPRDAVFVAVALNRGIPAILSADRGFDGIDGLRRVDPADERAVAALAVA